METCWRCMTGYSATPLLGFVEIGFLHLLAIMISSVAKAHSSLWTLLCSASI